MMRANKRFSKLGITPRGILCVLVLALGFLCYFSAAWYAETYGNLGFDSILFTLTAGLSGLESELLLSYVKRAVLRAVICTGFVSALLVFPSFCPRMSSRRIVVRVGRTVRFRIFPLGRRLVVLLSILGSLSLIGSAAMESGLPKFIYCIGNPSTFYEEYYCPPESVEIRFPERKRNLVYIYLESMETSFFSKEKGGALNYDVIPELSQLAQDNISFSNTELLGGAYCPTGTKWTSGSLVGQTSGLPLKIPIGGNVSSYGQKPEERFLPNAVTIFDILEDNGYNQSFMLGSDINFGGCYQYIAGHGVEQFYDHSTAMDDGIIAQGYKVWWGFEDRYLFEYAKQELTKLAEEEEPFAFSMMTIDTHPVDGYMCDLCRNEFPEHYENVFRCSSAQVYGFVKWLQAQPFYENTTVILVGDHPSMDAAYFSRNVPGTYDRRVYNCILNAAADTDRRKNREFSVFDMFPTTLAAMGCEIQGDRLGLGTNLFSDRPTLMEEMGIARFEEGVARYSEYYFRRFY